MSKKSYVVGFARIGEQRELKRVLESFWANKCSFDEVKRVSYELRTRHLRYQKEAGIEYISSNDFSLYDQMLDTAIMLNAIPKRFQDLKDHELYFAMARGDKNRVAMEMTKWFNTNYHYIVPELSLDDEYRLNSSKIINEYKEAKKIGIKTKINIIGPITFLALSKRIDKKDTIELLDKIVPLYQELLKEISSLDSEVVVQIEEPIFVKDNDTKLLYLIKPTYDKLALVSKNVKIAVVTYFEHANEAIEILSSTPIWAIGVDFVSSKESLESLKSIKKGNKVLIAGIVDGRNIWKNDIKSSLNLLCNISKVIEKESILISSSCSFLHIPYTLKYEDKMDKNIKNWLSFALEKLNEISIISKIFFETEDSLDEKELHYLKNNISANRDRRSSFLIHDQEVLNRVKNLKKLKRDKSYQDRIKLQKKVLKYPPLATTTIGSFPQTIEIRKARQEFKNSKISKDEYKKKMKEYIKECIEFQKECGLDILVHGEPERSDMVEYFATFLKGFGISQNGWVQSYGSRCVKPPFIYGDIKREKPITLEWILFAQNQTKKVVKGMLTGPVTMLNWSFVRDDMKKEDISKQIAVAISDEVDDLQKNGIKIIQVDEAAFKEGYPLRKNRIKEYENWAVRDFNISISSAYPKTQIHTHMCYSEFNDIIKTVEALDADVISIETARSGNELLKIFKEIGYKKEIGPGVYDIHSPRVPTVQEIIDQIKLLLEVLPKEQLWINPDCGLKTRKWDEVRASLKNMVKATKIVKKELNI